MRKNSVIFILSFLCFFLFNIDSVKADEDLPVFHLETTSVNFTDDNLSQDINYYITNSGLLTGTLKYQIDINDTELIDTHNKDNKIPVVFSYDDSEKYLDLSEEITDSTTLKGTIQASITPPHENRRLFRKDNSNFDNLRN